MKRPSRKDHDFNDPFDSLLFSFKMIQYADHLEEEVIAKADHIGYLNLQITELQTKYTALVNKIINLKWWQSIERIY
tara:strand:- start:128 stop:358 length:231 start_codon:yes stop_codon:yes gene_type:complete